MENAVKILEKLGFVELINFDRKSHQRITGERMFTAECDLRCTSGMRIDVYLRMHNGQIFCSAVERGSYYNADGEMSLWKNAGYNCTSGDIMKTLEQIFRVVLDDIRNSDWKIKMHQNVMHCWISSMYLELIQEGVKDEQQ